MKRTFSTILHKSFIAIVAPILSFSLAACQQDEILETDIPCEQDHAVDLGLSVKWACCNIGANSPEEYGHYYAWGELVEQPSCEWWYYKWHDNATGGMTKYNEEDGKKVLDPEDDAAQALGDGWRMPTPEEMQELKDRCKWEWVSVNGVYGYKVSGNGNSIFLPAAGSQYVNQFTSQGNQGCYLSSTLYSGDCGIAVCLGFNQKHRYTINSERCDGHTIRPVKK